MNYSKSIKPNRPQLGSKKMFYEVEKISGLALQLPDIYNRKYSRLNFISNSFLSIFCIRQLFWFVDPLQKGQPDDDQPPMAEPEFAF